MKINLGGFLCFLGNGVSLRNCKSGLRIDSVNLHLLVSKVRDKNDAILQRVQRLEGKLSDNYNIIR